MSDSGASPPSDPDRADPAQADVLGPQIERHPASQAPAGTVRPPSGTAPTSPPDGTDQSGPTLVAPGHDPSPPRPVLPAVFGRYRIRQVLGQGGMGTVYLAHDSQLDRPVALKVPHFREGADARLLGRFYREARIAATFTHPHLCPVYDVGEQGGIHFLTMPYLSGEPLSAWLERDGALPKRTAAHLAALIARALAVAHRAGVIHRDLKPANIMVNENREPVVMDFGLARGEVSGTLRLTAAGVLLGTPAYMAPEQIGGDPSALGPGCDLYSLGVILYEMLTGRLPFTGSLHEVLRLVLTEPPPPPSQIRPGLDARLERVCLTALAKKPSERFASMEAFAAALDEALQGSPDSPPAARSAEPLCGQEPSRPTPSTWPDQPAGEPRTSVLEDVSSPRGRQRSRRAVAVVLIGLGVAALLMLAWIAASAVNRSQRTEGMADALPIGSHWSGTFQFLPRPDNHHGDVQVTVTERDGDRFRGVYSTEGERYAWRIEGTLRGSTIHWSFARALRGEGAEALVGKGWVEGTLADGRMEVAFHDPNDGSVAEMKLRLTR